MMLNIDLLGIPGAEVTEHGGVRGIFIPEVPNLRLFPETISQPARAIMSVGMWKTRNTAQKYDYIGKMNIPTEHSEAFLSNPHAVSRKRYIAYGYSWYKGDGDTPTVSDASDFDAIIEK